jgi:hypothetical protein
MTVRWALLLRIEGEADEKSEPCSVLAGFGFLVIAGVICTATPAESQIFTDDLEELQDDYVTLVFCTVDSCTPQNPRCPWPFKVRLYPDGDWWNFNVCCVSQDDCEGNPKYACKRIYVNTAGRFEFFARGCVMFEGTPNEIRYPDCTYVTSEVSLGECFRSKCDVCWCIQPYREE